MQHIPGPEQLAAAKRIAVRTQQAINVVADIAARMEAMAQRSGTTSDLDYMERYWLGKGVEAVAERSFVCSGVNGVCWCEHSTWSIDAGADNRSGVAVPCKRAYRRAQSTGSAVRIIDPTRRSTVPDSPLPPLVALRPVSPPTTAPAGADGVGLCLPGCFDITDLLEDDGTEKSGASDPLDLIRTACVAILPGKRVPIAKLLERLGLNGRYLSTVRTRSRQRYNEWVGQLSQMGIRIVRGGSARRLYFNRVLL